MDITTGDAVVAHLQLRNHFNQQQIEIFPGADVGQQYLITTADRLPVQAVHVFGIEKLFLHAPDLIEYLPPFLPWVDEHLQVTGV